jgi:hypothetical protein
MRIFVRTQTTNEFMEINCASYKPQKTYLKKTDLFGKVVSREIFEEHYVKCCNKALGKYETKERCVEIVNEIWSVIKAAGQSDMVIYEMPPI